MNKNDLVNQSFSNSFDEVRLLLAFIVFFAHTSVLASIGDIQWLLSRFDSDFAITGFFAISGYLVTQSYLRCNSYAVYFQKRFRRIYPAYLLVIIYCLTIGVLSSSHTFIDFFTKHETISYIVANLSFLNFLQPELPGSLTHNNVSALNGSLWTIKVELMLYACIPFIIKLYEKIGLRPASSLILFFGVTYYIYFTEYFNHHLGGTIARQFPGQLPYFIIGSVLAFINLSKPQKILITILFIINYF